MFPIHCWQRMRIQDGQLLYHSQMMGNRDRDMCTVDGCHPMDLGFLRKAECVEPILRRILYE